MTSADIPKWQPDELLVPAILAGNRFITWDAMSAADRAWVALQLKDAGRTAEYTAEALSCSVRTVRAAISDDLGQVMRRYMDTAEHFDREHQMAHGEVQRLARTLAEAERDRDRYLGERNRMIDRAVSGEGGPVFSCGCPQTRYNTYVSPKTGKRGCRHHRTLAQRRYRERQAQRAG